MNVTRALLLTLFATLPLTSGCHEPTPLPQGAKFEVGTGIAEFKKLGSGATVPLTHGFQGGTHIWFSARFKGIDDVAALTYTIEDSSGSSIGNESEAMITDAADKEGWHVITGLTAVVDEDEIRQGQHIVLRGYLEDESGHEMEAKANATVKGDEDDDYGI